uniref:Uncharacterized protein n=1 Tax=Fagus sylvatica TaxID=28930 RepID=A0A2N9J2G0_FAGSY
MYAPHYVSSIKLPPSLCAPKPKIWSTFGSSQREFKIRAVSMSGNDASNYIPKAPIFLPEGPWKQIPGGVTAAEGFKAAGAFTTNVVAAAPVLYSKKAVDVSKRARAVLINAGQANAATGDAGYQDVIECATSLAEEALLNSLPKLVALMSSSTEGADSAAVAITTTDLVSKSIAIESQVGGRTVRVGAMAKGSGMIHPNIIFTAWLSGAVGRASPIWSLGFATRRLSGAVRGGLREEEVERRGGTSFADLVTGLRNEAVERHDGDTSTNDTVIALASGLSGSTRIASIDSYEALQLQACLDVVSVTGADSEAEAAKIARSVASSSLAAVYGRDPNWGRIAAAAGYAGISFHQNKLRVLLGDILLMDAGEPQPFDR